MFWEFFAKINKTTPVTCMSIQLFRVTKSNGLNRAILTVEVEFPVTF